MSKAFRRQHFWKYKRFGKSFKWRKPRGRKNAMKLRARGKLPMPSTGYRTPVFGRHLHPTGLIETRVFNVDGLNGIDSKYIVRIASTVGRRKRRTIFTKAREMGLRMIQSESKVVEKVKKTVKVESKAVTKPVTKATTKAEAFSPAGQKPSPKRVAKPKTEAFSPAGKSVGQPQLPSPKTATKPTIKAVAKPKTKAVTKTAVATAVKTATKPKAKTEASPKKATKPKAKVITKVVTKPKKESVKK